MDENMSEIMIIGGGAAGMMCAIAAADAGHQVTLLEKNEKLGKKQYLVPYLMSSHPGSTLKEAVELAEFLRDLGYMPEQVQDFYPTQIGRAHV